MGSSRPRVIFVSYLNIPLVVKDVSLIPVAPVSMIAMSETDDSEEWYCEKHKMKTPMYEDTGDPHCPKCRETRRIEQMRIEQSYVGHNMHPSVDAPRR
jgi:hypothetical protein